MRKVSYGFADENILEKSRWFLTLSLSERYNLSFDMAGFYGALRKGREARGKGSFKTIQVLKKRKS